MNREYLLTINHNEISRADTKASILLAGIVTSSSFLIPVISGRLGIDFSEQNFVASIAKLALLIVAITFTSFSVCALIRVIYPTTTYSKTGYGGEGRYGYYGDVDRKGDSLRTRALLKATDKDYESVLALQIHVTSKIIQKKLHWLQMGAKAVPFSIIPLLVLVLI